MDERVADLLSRMTLEEKIRQIAPSGKPKTEVIDPTGTYTSDSASAVLNRWWDPDLDFTPRRAAILRNGVQRYIKEKTRLGIPELFMGEALHGFMEFGSTSFPQALGLASTLDPDLVHQVFTAAGEEAGSSRRGTGLQPGARHCPRPALGTHRRNLRRRSVSGRAHGRGRYYRPAGRGIFNKSAPRSCDR